MSMPDNRSQRKPGRGKISRRQFLGLAGLALGSAALVKGTSRLDSFFNPRNAEAGPLDLDPIIDTTAPTFVSECAHAHIPPDRILGTEPIYITKTRLIGIFFGFPDQPQGLADLQAGVYSTAYLTNVPLVHDFYNHFTGINMTLETRPYIIAEHPWAYYATDFDKKYIREILFLMNCWPETCCRKCMMTTPFLCITSLMLTTLAPREECAVEEVYGILLQDILETLSWREIC